MSKNASDVLVEGLISWGVDTIFGLPGDGINGIMEALRQRKDKIRFIQVRHEEAAAFMACGYAKYTGKLGCCLATSGPGGIHLLNGLYDAKSDQAPVLAITGQTYSDLKGSNYQQEVNMTLLFEDVALYNEEVINPAQVEMLINEACRRALNGRGVAHITFPVDYQEQPADRKKSVHKGQGGITNTWSPPCMIPPKKEIQRAADLIAASKKPVILCGRGSLGAKDELTAFAELIHAPVVKALLGKGAMADDHPLCLGGIGLLGTGPSEEAMEECDLLIMVGTSFPYMEYLPNPEKARGIQIDDRPDRIGLRFPVEIGLVGDAKSTLNELLEKVERRTDRSFLDDMQGRMRDWWKLMKEREDRDETPIKPQRVAGVLSPMLESDAIVSTDSGTITSWAARHIRMRGDMMFSCSGNLASMAPGLPYAIAAKVAFPHRQSIAFVGDGGFTMLMGEFATAVKYNLPIVVVIIKNNSLGQIKWEQIVFLGNPEYACDLQPIDFAKYAESCGGIGISVEHPDDLQPAFERALASNRPCVVEVAVDPFEPPMPARVKAKQAIHFAEALIKGEPNGKQIALTIYRDKFAELL